ncbi:MAG TPA: multicopper oxidase family protein [Acidimicrobiales bacterium]|nr:multicopper oxidase family protein [Acidimicrobiales bacterium]
MTDLSRAPGEPDDGFSTDTTGLEPASTPEVVRLHDGDRFELRIAPVAKRIGDDLVRMLAYGGSIPGPVLQVDEGSEIEVEVRNDGDTEATVHWHGLRLENRYDGVPHETQAPIPVGGTFRYKVQFPDPGFYWYHPHIREDYGLEMGLYGTILVDPAEPGYWPAADRQLSITLDDLLVEEGHVAPFWREGLSFTAMGRFGNVMLTNGQTTLSESAAVNEVVRLCLVNTANTRIFKVALPGARIKLVGGDSGRYEHETFVEEVLLAPSERAIVDVLFDTPGAVPLEHRTPDHVYTLGEFRVAGTAAGEAARTFDTLRSDPTLVAERESLGHDLERPPDKVLAFSSLMPLLYGGADTAADSYACPMHPEVTATEPTTCPKCGMKLVALPSTTYACPMHPEVTATEPATCPKCGMKLVPSSGLPVPPTGAEAHHGGDHGHESDDGIEWEDLMPEINRQTDATNMIWKLIDRQTDDENAAIRWAFSVGDRVKIRLVNEMEGSEHPMHHPFHVHGAGRFLVLSRDGEPEPNLVWKDTVLLPAGRTVDILLDVSNPGRWMAHCHIAEHNQAGMMFSFDVSRRAAEPA